MKRRKPPSTLWVQKSAPDRRMLELTAGSDQEWDRQLLPFDIRGSLAHVAGLTASGLLGSGEARRLSGALDAAAKAFARGKLGLSPDDEDCHTTLERFVTDRLGRLGGKLHTGRSRNDQVATALRLYIKHHLARTHQGALALVDRLLAFAARHGDVPLPGYTHTRAAMPSSLAHWSAAFAAGLLDTLESLPALWTTLDRSPLGSASGYGVPLPLDRTASARAGGFAGPEEPVTLVQNGRGKLEAAVLFFCAQLGHDAGKLACDAILFTGGEFGYLRLDPRFATGSSLMPHKQNPDLFELARARARMIDGDLSQVLALRANLGSGYHRDFQLLKEPLMRGMARSCELLELLTLGVAALTPDRDRCTAAIDSGVRATGEALRRAAEGIPFREAYQSVARELQQAVDPPDFALPPIDLGGLRARAKRVRAAGRRLSEKR